MKLTDTQKRQRAQARRHGLDAKHWLRVAVDLSHAENCQASAETAADLAIECAQRAWRWAVRSVRQDPNLVTPADGEWHAVSNVPTVRFVCPDCGLTFTGHQRQEFDCKVCRREMRKARKDGA